MNCENKPAKTWALINKLSYNKIKETKAPAEFQTETATLTDPLEICEHFNQYFSTIGESLTSEIPSFFHHNNIFATDKHTVLSEDQMLSQLIPTTTEEVLRIINNISLNTASGIDGINTKSVKCFKNLISPELTKCINECLQSGIFPCSLKIAKVTPIFKSGNRSNPGNYRPISVLPVISKVFEKILYNHLQTFLESNNFLYNKQYGFRRKSNTLSATIDLNTKIKLNIDQKYIA
ncbi:unnamed protein product [Parnassius mnemosyne]|uniref:Reverse transcriptase domain-containing protein n=1 Tax=Parnassius mnemosyne TaxID=213953 RepID=A0AAV1KCN8_9NEOP